MRSQWIPLLAGVAVGVLLVWFFTPRLGPDTTLLEALRDSVAVAQIQITRDSARMAIVDDSLRDAQASAETITLNAHLIASAARRRATVAEAGLRTTLDSLGASTVALDSLVVAHTAEVAAKDAEIAARDRERTILWRRVELSDTVIADLRAQIARQEAVDVERESIEARLRHDLRGAKIRERIAEAGAIAALTWKVLG